MFRTTTIDLKKETGLTGSRYDVLSSTPQEFSIAKAELEASSNKYAYLFDQCSDKDFIVEINKRENWHILAIMNCAFHKIFDYLEENQKYNYSLTLYLSQDIEIPEWRQFTIEVKSQLEDFEAREDLWDKLIDIFNQSYNEYLQRTNIVETELEKDAYRKISVIVD